MTGPAGLGAMLPHRRADAERFAALLDGRRVDGGTADHPELADLARLAAALAPAEHRPDPSFRTALRERLVAEAASRPVPAQRAADQAVPRAAEAESRPRWRTAVATLAVAAVVSGAGAAAASHRALPGDSLYGLKRQIESVELALAHGDLNRGRELLEQAEARLGEAERLAASSGISEPGTRADLVATLADMQEATEEGSFALTEAYQETGDAEPLRILQDFAEQQQERLRDLLALLDPGLRATVRPLLADLASIERTATILLGSSVLASAGTDAAGLGQASGDGWAVSMLLDRTAASTGDAGSTLAGGAGATGSLTDPGSPGGGLVSGLVQDVAGALDGGSGTSTGSGSGTGGGSAGASGAGIGDAVDDVGDTVGDVTGGVDGVLDPVTSPLVSSTPLPTSTPLPSLSPSTVASPQPTVSVCVTLVGVETC